MLLIEIDMREESLIVDDIRLFGFDILVVQATCAKETIVELYYSKVI